MYRLDYTPFPYSVSHVGLTFTLNEEATTVDSVIEFDHAHVEATPPPLILDGRKDITLKQLLINSEDVDDSSYELTAKTLTLQAPPSGKFTLQCTVEIKPQENTSLEGLYKSSGNFCSQCEVRRGTWALRAWGVGYWTLDFGLRVLTFWPSDLWCGVRAVGFGV